MERRTGEVVVIDGDGAAARFGGCGLSGVVVDAEHGQIEQRTGAAEEDSTEQLVRR